MKISAKKLGERLKALRIVAGYPSAQQFAYKIDLMPHTYRHYEAGREYPRIVTLLRICDELHVTPNDLLTLPE